MEFQWSTLWLILHIAAIIVGFGPTFVFALVATSMQKEPQHALFGARLLHLIETRLVIPALTLAPLFGAALIITKRYEFWKSLWLLIAVPIFIGVWSIGVFVARPLGNRIQATLEEISAGRGGPESMQELEGLGKRSQLFGMLMMSGMAAILVLMIWRPGACFVGQPGC